MKRKMTCFIPIYLICLFLCFAMLFAGCSQSNSGSEPENDIVSSHTANDTTLNKVPKRKADLYGKVKTILGNEVTLEVAEMPEGFRDASGENNGGLSEAEREKRREEMQNMDPEQRQQMKNDIKLTGETRTFIIPVGVPIVSIARGDSGSQETALELTDIYEGTFLQVWFEEGSTGADGTVECVRVMPSRQQ